MGSLRKAQRLLKCMGFGIIRRRHFEKNNLFDFADGRFRKKGVILRLRSIRKNYILTFKGPLQPSRFHKKRKEIEMVTSEGASLKENLEKVGLSPIFSYEKHRTLYSSVNTKQGIRSGQIALDETPFGVFLELEGVPTWIDRTARKLGFCTKDYIKKSYPTLYESNAGQIKKSSD